MQTLEIDGVKISGAAINKNFNFTWSHLIKPYYAGHVLGACMFLVEYKGIKVLYTGDFNSNADRHLGAAYIEKIEPDLQLWI